MTGKNHRDSELDLLLLLTRGGAAVVLTLLLVFVATGAGWADEPEPPDQNVAEEAAGADEAPAESSAQTTVPEPSYHQLVSVAGARAARVEVQVAGTVDRGSVRELEVDGVRGMGFTLTGADGETLEVVHPGKLPVAFGVEQPGVVVLVGTGADGVFRATEMLVPGGNEGLLAVLGVTMVVWVGLFAYAYRLGGKLRRLERQ